MNAQTQHTPGLLATMDRMISSVGARADRNRDADLQAAHEARATVVELLAALQGLLAAHGAVTQGLERELYETWIPKARSALAKARGEA